jgi:hypothetical protein
MISKNPKHLASQAKFCGTLGQRTIKPGGTLGQRTIKPGLSRKNLDKSDPYMDINQRLNECGLSTGSTEPPPPTPLLNTVIGFYTRDGVPPSGGPACRCQQYRATVQVPRSMGLQTASSPLMVTRQKGQIHRPLTASVDSADEGTRYFDDLDNERQS